MITGSILGLETEYAVMLPQAGEASPTALFDVWQPFAAFRWDYGVEHPGFDARGFVSVASVASRPEALLEQVDAAPPPAGPDESGFSLADVSIRAEEPPSYLLGNGARFYLDHTHPELSIPECSSPLEAVAYDKAGEAWLNLLARIYNRSRPAGEQITLYKNNVDAHGHTYGCHENYLVDSATYADLFGARSHRLYTVLIPFFVTRQILSGAGLVDRLDTGEVGFHISQRAGFFETLLGVQTTSSRPIINTRDEAHADPSRFRRLHVIVGDSNMAEAQHVPEAGHDRARTGDAGLRPCPARPHPRRSARGDQRDQPGPVLAANGRA